MWVFIGPVHRVMSVGVTRQFKIGFICPHDFRKQFWSVECALSQRTVVWGLDVPQEGQATVWGGASDIVMMSSGSREACCVGFFGLFTNLHSYPFSVSCVVFQALVHWRRNS
ncbi:hypothetical protein TNCV_3676691 [Trichonephila clavipes]|nr:hypothetical protein TNCV_3676691 [Trichonephila clavipes]